MFDSLLPPGAAPGAPAGAAAGPAFAVLRRAEGPQLRGAPAVEILVGDVVDVATLAELPPPAPGLPVLALVPFHQVAERGFEVREDPTPLRCLVAREYRAVPLAEALAELPTDQVTLHDGRFDLDDESYAEIVKQVISEEIGTGEGANFVIRRDHLSRQELPTARAALALFRRLLLGEPGAYWTFAVHTPELAMVGATPERHVSVRDGHVVMNPISGTYRHPGRPPQAEELLRFLADRKEVEELFMVVDEELKMMSRICAAGGRVLGPYLKRMGHLTHTEYLLAGRTGLDVREVLRETLFAATVTGSPVENAIRVIDRYETTGRGYYSGLAALLTAEPTVPGAPRARVDLDAPILIRTAYLAPDGGVRIPVGATLVRHSVPEAEVAETHAKIRGVLAAFEPPAAPAVGGVAAAAGDDVLELPEVRRRLAERNQGLARFWLDAQGDRVVPELAGRTAVIVDAEDAWTEMLGHLLRRSGMQARVVPWRAFAAADPADLPADLDADLLVAGPGPGDPRRLTDPRIATLRRLLAGRLESGAPLLAVCLSHQILAGLLGLGVEPLAEPFQGTARQVPVAGRQVRVGFYNTFTARLPQPPAAGPRGLEVWADPATREVFGLRRPGLASVQFHLESILSTDGADLLAELAGGALAGADPASGRR